MHRHRGTFSFLVLATLLLVAGALVTSRAAARGGDGSAALSGWVTEHGSVTPACQGALLDRTTRATRLYQETSTKLAYSRPWKSVSNARCYSGKMRKLNAAGSVTAAFSGTGVSVYATKGRAYGIMKVTLDGVARRVSLYARTTAYRQKVFARSGLANGTPCSSLSVRCSE
jgi:hypothetical protein